MLKIIELSPETEKRLRIIAVNAGYNLKSYIENVLDEIADEDELLIALSNAEGTNELLAKPEKIRFIKSPSELTLRFQEPLLRMLSLYQSFGLRSSKMAETLITSTAWQLRSIRCTL